MFRSFLCLVVAAGLLGACGAHEPQPLAYAAQSSQINYLWWEAEKPSATNFPARHSFEPADASEAAKLSEGKWIGADGNHGTLFAEYKITPPKEGEYFLFARKFWKHGPFRWRIDSGPWSYIDSNVTLLDEVSLRQFLGANWVSLGKVKLGSGQHTMRLETTTDEGAVCFDCFMIIDVPFVPSGLLRPGEKAGGAPQGWFAFEPDPDVHAPSPIDLSWLNEDVAGEKGRIRVKNGAFVHEGTDEVVRFWAINTGLDGVRMDPVLVDMYAKFLAKKGVNMVRVHGAFYSHSPQGIVTDEATIDALHYYVASMKREGIYVSLSIYFPLWLNASEGQGLEGYSGQNPFALLFFDPVLQGKYRDWWTALMTKTNPHTGMTLAEDPAVAIAELCNEDSYFFWTFTPYGAVPEQQIMKLERKFGTWLGKKYGSPRAALAKWGGDPVRGDAPDQGRVGILANGRDGWRNDLRAQDTCQFLAEDQRAFFETYEKFLKDDLGYKGLVYGSNWITADSRILGPLDKWSNTVNDLMDRHGYYGGRHTGDRAAYSLNADEVFVDRAAVRFDPEDPVKTQERSFGNPIQDITYNNLPSMITEINWPMPNRFRADFPLLSAAYGLLQGSDAFYFFAHQGPGWQALNKFPIATPVTMGQFPATAAIYRLGLVQPGDVVVEANLDMPSLFELKGAPVSAPQNLDAMRQADVPIGQGAQINQVESIDPLAFFVGQVKMNFVDAPKPSRAMELSKFIDRDGKVVTSSTGELNWNYGSGLVTVNAPAVSAATGFLEQAGTVSTDAATFELKVEYGTAILVALDGKPLSQSEKMLLQVMTEDQNRDWEAEGVLEKVIVHVGGAPVVVKNVMGTVRLKRSDASSLKVRALDLNGYPVRELEGGAGQIRLLPNVLYYSIEKG